MDFINATARNAARVLVFALLVAAARGDTLRAKLDLIAPRLRPGAPALAELKIARQGAPLLEGVFDVEVGEGGAPFLRWRTPEFALINGAQAFRVMLPPVPEEARSSSLEAHLRFIAKNGAQFDLGTSPLAGSQSGQLLLGVCVPEGARGQAEIRPVWQSLRPERFRYRDPGGQIALTTTPAFFTPGELPASAAQLLALDAVLISGPAFAQLRERQLQALLRWVDAGGSVCVLVEGQLESAALNFLNQLAADQAPAPPYELDPTGTLGTSAARIGEWRCGLGRAVIITTPLTLEELDLPDWRRVLTFLWKVAARRAANLTARGDWGAGELDSGNQMSWRGGAENSEILTAMTGLLPEAIRPIPWLELTAMLGVFLLAIGPGEYFVLGWLRRRRWTWITFPLSALVCSLCVLRLAERTFGVQDRPASVIITDVGKRGRILRETRFDLLFAADSREARTEVHNAIAVGLRGPSGEPESGGAVRYEGRVPSQYTLCRSLRKWTPTYLRTTSLEGGADPSGVLWEAFDPALLNSGASSETLTSKGSDPDLEFSYHREFGHFRGWKGRFQLFAVRVLLVVEVPVVIVCALVVAFAEGLQASVGVLTPLTVIVGALGILAVSVASANTIVSERVAQTLEVLLTTPLTAKEIVMQKARALRRLTLVAAIPVVTVLATKCWLRLDWPLEIHDGWLPYLVCNALAVAIYFPLVSWLGVWIGLHVRTRFKAISATLICLVVWNAVPLLSGDYLAHILALKHDLYILLWLLAPVSILQVNEEGMLSRLLYSTDSLWAAIALNFSLHGLLLLILRVWSLGSADRCLRR